jgi:Na+-transporting NADH:ubiquinone oxidoreductase subunit NqrD
MTDEQGYIAAVILCLLNVFLFTLIYKKIPKWYDGITKLVQLIEIFSFYFIIIQVFNVYEYRLNLTIGIIAVALAGDSLEIYHGVLKNAFTKEGRRSLFKADKL